MNNRVMFIHPETMVEQEGQFVKYVGAFTARIRFGKVYFDLDLDDFWAI